MNITVLSDESTASRCLSLIERNAAKFIRMGGSPTHESGVREMPDLTPKDRAEIIAVCRGDTTIRDVEKLMGWSETTIRKVLREAGEPTPLERKLGKKMGRPPGKRVGPRGNNRIF